MKERRLSREMAMQVLFQWEAQGVLSENRDSLDVEGFLGHFIHLFYVRKNDKIDRRFAADLLRGTLSSLDRIDSLLEDSSNKWKVSRMDAIDRAILRMACFELAIKKIGRQNSNQQSN